MQEEKTTRELIINPELQTLLPPLPQEAFDGLEASILKHGCLSSLVVWNDTIVDGHWRYMICKKHGLAFNVRNVEFEDLYDAMIWVYKKQLGQRNLDRKGEDEGVKPAHSEPIILKIDPKMIRIDLGTQVRLALDEEAIDDYTSAMKRGDQFPPIHVFYNEKEDEYILVDGFHRYFAHQKALPGELITVKCQEGDLESARWAAIGANKHNSVRRTNADKKRAVEWALIHACGVKMSNRQIAAHVGVDEVTVRRTRARLETTATLPQSTERIGRDGRTTNTSNIGKLAKSRPVNSDIPLKVLLDRLDHDDAESFFAGAIDIFRRNNKLDQGTAERMLRQLASPANG